MKKLLFVLSVLTSSAVALGQKTLPSPPAMPRNPEDTSKIYYMEVVEMPGINKDELFRRGRILLNNYYKNPGGIIQEVDSLNGKIILLPQFPTYRTLKNGVKAQSAIVRYYIELGFKEGKYRFQIHDIHLKDDSYIPIEKLFKGDDPNVEDNYNTLTEAHIYFQELIADLKKEMNEPSSKEKKDEW